MDERTAIRPDITVGEDLRTDCRDILARARAAIEDPAQSDAEAVHDFRRAMKRWRALLRLLGAFAGEEARALRDEARDLARALAGARDPQSALDALADLVANELALSARSVARLRSRIKDIRRAAETTLDADMRMRLGMALAKAWSVVENWPLELAQFEDVARELARFYRGGRRRVPADWQAASVEELHELRKHVVIHRYQIEIVQPLWPRYVKMWTGEAQRLREELGKHHDLFVLASLAGPRQPLAHWRSHLAPRHRGAKRRACAHRRAHRRAAVRGKAEGIGAAPYCVVVDAAVVVVSTRSARKGAVNRARLTDKITYAVKLAQTA
jgi:CHAD domain-containing protein